MAFLEQIIGEAGELFAGLIPAAKRIHPAFGVYDGDYWYFNAPARVIARYDNVKDAEKVRLLLNDDNLEKLDDLPFFAKLSCCHRHDDAYKYCIILLPRPGMDSTRKMLEWARSKGLEATPLTGLGR